LFISLSKQKNPELDKIFVNLDNDQLGIVELAKQKSKRKWLRLYGLRIDSNTYVITGGAIKLTRLMKDRVHTQKELDKLEKCRNYLRELGVFDLKSFHELRL
jgi:hypothetical protein